MNTPELLKIDRNGSKHWRGRVKCDRCGGDGIYKWGAVINGLTQYAGVCFKCNGLGWVVDEWIERTPEYQAKLDARRAAKRAKQEAEEQAKLDAERTEREAAEKAEAERKESERLALEAEKAISQFVGAVGEKLTVTAVYIGSPYFERKSFAGYGTETCYINTFKDADGNKILWKTGRNVGSQYEVGQTVEITGTVKEHSEYKGEKQTVLIRCNFKEVKS